MSIKYSAVLLSSLLLLSLVAPALLTAEEPPVVRAEGRLHHEIQRLDRVLQDRLARLATGVARSPGQRDESEHFSRRIQRLETEARQLSPAASEQLLRKLDLLKHQVSNLCLATTDTSLVPGADLETRRRVTRLPTEGPLPVNDDCQDAITIGFGTFMGDTTSATNDGEASCGSSLFAPDVWFKVVAPQTGSVFLDTLGSTFDTVLSVHTACPGTIANQVACDDDGAGAQSATSFIANAGEERWIRVSGFGGATGGFTLGVGEGGEIAGTVTDAVTGDPLQGIHVEIWNPDGFFVRSGTTDAAGRYVSAGSLLSGTYFVSTDNPYDYIDELYDDRPCPGGAHSGCDPTTGESVQVTLGTTVDGIDFALSPAGSISGTIIDASTGSGTEGARVEIWDAAGDFAGSATTDSLGGYVVGGLAAGTYFAGTDTSQFLDELYDDLPCPGGTPGGCDVTTGSPIEVVVNTVTPGIDFVLDRQGGISGVVTDAMTGDPVPSIEVNIYNASGSYRGSDYTDAAGTYSVGGLDAGHYCALTGNYADYAAALYDDLACSAGCTVTTGTPIDVEINVTTSGIDFALDQLGKISGTVTDSATGDPLASVLVEIWNASGSYETGRSTDSSGNYAVEGLEPGTYFAVTDDRAIVNQLYDGLPCPGGPSVGCVVTSGTPIAVSLNATAAGVDFAVTPKGAISGTVTDAVTGAPITSGYVEIWNASGAYVDDDYLDSFGEFHLTGLDAGTYFAVTDFFSGSGYLDELYDDIPCMGGSPSGCDPTTGTPIAVSLGATTAGIDFAIGSGGMVTGTVTDSATGAPVTSGYVQIYDALGSFIDDDYLDSSGDYSLRGLATGTYFARTSVYSDHLDELYDDLPCGSGCAPVTGTPIAVTIGATTTGIDFALDRLGAISGTVTDATTGLAITSGRVQLWNAAGSYVGSGGLNSSGMYTVSGLASGTYFAATDAYSNDYLDELYDDLPCGAGCLATSGTPIAVVVNATTSGIDFALDHAGALSGAVTETSTGGPLTGIGIEVWSSGGSFVASSSTDTSGIYTVGGLATGAYFVTTTSSGYINQLYDGLPCEGGCDPTVGTPVATAVNSTTRHIDFALDRGAILAGTVTAAASGGPLSNVRVDIWVADGQRVDYDYTDATGGYAVDGLPSGTFFVTTDNNASYMDELYDDLQCPGGGFSGCNPTTGTPVATVINTTTAGIDFELESFGALTGTVTDDATGDPVSGLRVELWDAAGAYLWSRTTNASGSYTFAGLAAGTYYATTDNFNGYLDEMYDDLPCVNGAPSGCDPDKGTPIVVVLGATTTGIDFALIATDTGLTGVVTDAVTGSPMPGVLIDIWSAAGAHLETTVTRPSGAYYAGLEPGVYFVSTDAGNGTRADEIYDNLSCPGPAFGGHCDPTAGHPVSVVESGSVGQPGVTADIDFALESSVIFADGFESGDVSAWSASVGDAGRPASQ